MRKIVWSTFVLSVIGIACLCAGFILSPAEVNDGGNGEWVYSEDEWFSFYLGTTFSDAENIKSIDQIEFVFSVPPELADIKNIQVRYVGDAPLVVVVVCLENGEIHIWFDEVEPISVEQEQVRIRAINTNSTIPFSPLFSGVCP